ncbi:MAG: hypothetical protein WCI47_02390 [bacterium]
MDSLELPSNQKSSGPNMILGLIVIGIGLFFLLRIVGLGSQVDIIAAKFWPVLIMIFGMLWVAQPNGQLGGLALIMSGGGILLKQLGVLPPGAGQTIVWILIVLLGIAAATRSVRKKSKE